MKQRNKTGIKQRNKIKELNKGIKQINKKIDDDQSWLDKVSTKNN